MPMTVNGIGTHYVGKRNRQTRVGVCRACNFQSSLDSYDTRLWFVILFIPVIPLGRKRIIDQCGHCRRHWVAEWSSYEMSKQLGISGAMDRYREQPSPEAALDAHATLLSFQQFKEAEDFRQLALREQEGSSLLCAGLASQLSQVGETDEAARLFEQSLGLRPDLPEARVGVARMRMADGKLDEARELLQFLSLPGAAQLYSLEPLELLAQHYQRAGRHTEVLELCKCLLAELPNIGQIRQFRKFVRESETALADRESILPRRTFSLRNLVDPKSGHYASWQRTAALGAIVATVVAFGLIVANFYPQQHRRVYLINELGPGFHVAIDGKAVSTRGSLTELRLSEGRHHVKITGPNPNEFDLNMTTGWSERWTYDPVWVINVDGGMALISTTLHYATSPRPSQWQFIVGKKWLYFPHVDYAFAEPPPMLGANGSAKEIIKTQLTRADEGVDQLFQHAVDHCELADALTFAESHLRQSQGNVVLLDSYVQATIKGRQVERACEFLKTFVDQRPINVQWHRAYQDLRTATEGTRKIASEYDALLAQDRQNAALLYLRGRVEERHRNRLQFYQRARSTDPSFPWPVRAFAYEAAAAGKWQTCRDLAEQAIGLQLNEPGLRRIRHTARLATNDTDAMKSEYMEQLRSGAARNNAQVLLDLCEVLVARGETDTAHLAIEHWKTQLPPDCRCTGMVSLCEEVLLYFRGDFAAICSMEPNAAWKTGPEFRLQVLAAAGRPQEVAQDASLQSVREQPWNALAVSLAFSIGGNSLEAERFVKIACTGLNQGDADSRLAAAILQDGKPPEDGQLDEVIVPAQEKALLAAVLAYRFPANRMKLLALARKLNVSRLPPHQLVRLAIKES
jgi:tetratricopeptide (TPR) repeat protein